jgi:hypothetical protein
MTNDLERRPTRLPTRERIMRRVLGAVVTLGTGTLILTLAIDQPISIVRKVTGRRRRGASSGALQRYTDRLFYRSSRPW